MAKDRLAPRSAAVGTSAPAWRWPARSPSASVLRMGADCITSTGRVPLPKKPKDDRGSWLSMSALAPGPSQRSVTIERVVAVWAGRRFGPRWDGALSHLP